MWFITTIAAFAVLEICMFVSCMRVAKKCNTASRQLGCRSRTFEDRMRNSDTILCPRHISQTIEHEMQCITEIVKAAFSKRKVAKR